MSNPENIVLRSEKGAALTYEEMDQNFLEFRNQIIEFDVFVDTIYQGQQSQINSIILSFNGMNETIDVQNQRISNIESDHDILDLRVGNLEEDVGAFHLALLDISNLDHRVTTNEGRLDVLEVNTQNMIEWISVSANTTMLPNKQYMVDFSSARSLTLPASPLKDDKVSIAKSIGSMYGSTIVRNGSTIMGLDENLTIDTDVTLIEFVYNGTTWRIV